ncbi:Mss4-like protein [Trichoderma barbatum]
MSQASHPTTPRSHTMADSKTETKTLEAKCLCGSIHFTVDVPVASLPLPLHICHCSICRYATGAPCIFHAPLGNVLPNFIAPSSEKNLTTYSIKGADCTYDFCSTCGCHIGGIALDRSDWTVSTSIFTDHSPENFMIKSHTFSDSAKDKGLAQILTHAGDRKVPDWNPPKDDPRAKIVESEPEVGEDGQERLRAQCHCGGVSFTIKRPTQEIIEHESLRNAVSPVDPTKWIASYDMCDDCRIGNGTHLVGWAFLPLSYCEPEIKSDLKVGTSKTYSSSPGVSRCFCGTCGATVFYYHESRKLPGPGNWHVMDLATGILRAPEGSMAENWLTWRSRLAWADSGKKFDPAFGIGMEEGMKKYVIGKIGKELDVDISF